MAQPGVSCYAVSVTKPAEVIAYTDAELARRRVARINKDAPK